MAGLAARLPAIIKGDDEPRDAVDRINLASLAHAVWYHVFATRPLVEALELDRTLGDVARTSADTAPACSCCGCVLPGPETTHAPMTPRR